MFVGLQSAIKESRSESTAAERSFALSVGVMARAKDRLPSRSCSTWSTSLLVADSRAEVSADIVAVRVAMLGLRGAVLACSFSCTLECWVLQACQASSERVCAGHGRRPGPAVTLRPAESV